MLLKNFNGVKMCLAIRDWHVALNSKIQVEFSQQCRSQCIYALLLVTFHSKFESLVLKLNGADTNPQVLAMMA